MNTNTDVSQKTALVTGAPGQDANWAARLLLSRGYKVILTYRYSSTPFSVRFKDYKDILGNSNLTLYCLDITDPSGINELVREGFDEIYNFAALSHVHESFKNPAQIFQIDTLPIVYFLEAIRQFSPHSRFIQSSTSEMWGSNFTLRGKQKFQDESTPFSGNSPYAVAKIAAHNMVSLYRKSYHLFCCSSICHNHESKFRGENFVTRKITKWLAGFNYWLKENGLNTSQLSFSDSHIYDGPSQYFFPKLALGNINAVRDWSHSADFVRASWMMLQQDSPDDYVLASGEGRSVEDFLRESFALYNLDYRLFFRVDPQFYRPCEVEFLRGDATKAREKLGWTPKISFANLVKEMVEHDLQNYTG